MSVEQQLRQELAALQHELRRIRDGLERSPTHELEQRAQLLTQNISLCEKELQVASIPANEIH